MKLSRKGFMLAEVVVVAVVIATVLVTLFTGLNNVSSAYEIRNRYYDIDSLYIAMEVNDIWNKSGYIDTLKSNNLNFSCGYGSCDNTIESFGNFYVDGMNDAFLVYFAPYTEENIKSLTSHNNMTPGTFNDYVEYLSGNLDFTADYNYIIIVERFAELNIDDCYYYALKLKY